MWECQFSFSDFAKTDPTEHHCLHDVVIFQPTFQFVAFQILLLPEYSMWEKRISRKNFQAILAETLQGEPRHIGRREH